MIPSTQPGEITPFESSNIVLALPRPVPLDQFEGPSEVAGFDCVLGQVQVGDIEKSPCSLLTAFSALSFDRFIQPGF
jgi:hypothetical protein